jgi:hypothetical protein
MFFEMRRTGEAEVGIFPLVEGRRIQIAGTG